MGQLVKCRKPDCRRQVPLDVAFCCAPCCAADYLRCEIDRHSDGCDQRAAERGGT